MLEAGACAAAARGGEEEVAAGLGAAELRISGAGAAQAAPSLKRWRGDEEGVSEMERRENKEGRESPDLPARALLAARR